MISAFLCCLLPATGVLAADRTETVQVRGTLSESVVAMNSPHTAGMRAHVVTPVEPIPVSVRPEPVSKVALLVYDTEAALVDELLGQVDVVTCEIEPFGQREPFLDVDFCSSPGLTADDSSMPASRDGVLVEESKLVEE